MKIVATYILFLVSFFTWGQSNRIEAALSKTSVTENEVFTYQITAYNDCDIIAPDFGDLEVLGLPSKGYFNSSTNINGVQTNTTTYTLTYTLRATKKGTYKIGPAKLKCKLKKEVRSNETLVLTVVSAGTSNSNNNQKPGYFFKLTSNKSSVYVGEPFVISFRFYSPQKPSSIEMIEQGNASGLWRNDLNPNPTSYVMTQEDIKGVRYYVLELKTEVCIPLRSGKIVMEPYSASIVHQVDFFSSERQNGPSNSLEIDVKKLPEKFPPNFNGLVGDFKLKVSADKKKITQGQAFELTLLLSGTGNFNAFDEVKLVLPDGFVTGDPDINDQTKVSKEGLTGKIEYKFVVSAEQIGEFSFVPFTFSYFDLSSKSYQTLGSDKISIQVEKGSESHGAVYSQKEKIEIQETDVRFIHLNEGNRFTINDFIFGTPLYFWLLISPLFFVIILVFFKRSTSRKTEEDKAELRRKKSGKTASKSFQQAHQQLKKGADKEAIKTVQSTLINYLLSKLNLSLSALSEKSISEELKKKNVPDDLILQFSNVWKNIEMAQYAPLANQNINTLITQTQQLILQLDEKL